MTTLDRRRFLAISAGVLAATGLPADASVPLHQWRGVAMGADASITLAHPQAEEIVARALAEIARLEAVFSLHHAESTLVRLNRDGGLEAPPFELLECFALCGRVHAATGGMFDPTIQPLWALHAESHAAGVKPSDKAIADTLARTGWDGVGYDSASVRLARPGMALSLNGVAQGFVADRVVEMLAAQGLTDILVNTGEYRALGGHPAGGGWPVTLSDGERLIPDAISLRDMAVASSAPHGITFDADGRESHVIDPTTGRPAPARWRLVSVAAPQAGVADALGTAFCLMERDQIETALAAFPSARIVHLG